MSFESSAYSLKDRVDGSCKNNCQFKKCEKCRDSEWNKAGRERDQEIERRERESKEASISIVEECKGQDRPNHRWKCMYLKKYKGGEHYGKGYYYIMGSDQPPYWSDRDGCWCNPVHGRHDYLDVVKINSGDPIKWRRGW